MLWWVLATSVGLVLGGAVAATVEGAVRRSWYGVAMPEAEEVLKSTINVGAMLAVWGAIVGSVQWTVLRRRLDRAGWWAPATAAGWGLAGVFAGGLSALLTDLTPSGSDNITLLSLVVGLVPFVLLPGVFQWFGLRRRVAAAARWLWGSAGAFFLAGVGGFAVVRGGMVSAGWLTPYDFPSVKVFVLFGVVMAPVYGAVTGLVMAQLLRARGTTTS